LEGLCGNGSDLEYLHPKNHSITSGIIAGPGGYCPLILACEKIFFLLENICPKIQRLEPGMPHFRENLGSK